MKKFIFAGFCLAIIFTISTGCGRGNNSSSGGLNIPSIVKWHKKTYTAPDDGFIKKKNIVRSIGKGKANTVTYKVYKIKNIDPTDAIALRVGKDYWKYVNNKNK